MPALTTENYNKYRKIAAKKCQELAKSVKKDLSKKYEELTEKFYDEYSNDGFPEVYERHLDRGYPTTGMSKTYKPYYKNKNNQTFIGGIIISEERMYDGYETSKKYQPIVKTLVLYSFCHGYHGLPGNYSGTRLSKVQPIEDMKKYKAKIMKKYRKKMDVNIDRI